MLSTPDGPFIQVGRLNLQKYAQNPAIAPALFEHLFHQMNDIRTVRTNERTIDQSSYQSNKFRLFN